MEIKEYIKQKIADRDIRNAELIKKGYRSYSYPIFNSRRADEKIVDIYREDIIAEMENDFGWAFIIKGKIGYFFFTLLTDDFGYRYGNPLARWKDSNELRFIKSFGDKLRVINQEEYSKIINQMAMKRLAQDNKNENQNNRWNIKF